MNTLRITISNEDGIVTGEYDMQCVARPGIDSEAFDSRYVIDLIRSQAERHKHLADFALPAQLSRDVVSFDLSDPNHAVRLHNVNELWFEIENLFHGSRLNFATARMIRELESAHPDDETGQDARLNLHLEKMERFHLAVFEMSRVEDLVSRLVYEYFEGFIEGVDESRPGWEKRVTWDRMKDALNQRSRPDGTPHEALMSMEEDKYLKLMELIRSYRTANVLALVSYRDRRTHRAAPTVDYPGFGASLQQPIVESGVCTFVIGHHSAAEFTFEDLYMKARSTYAHLVSTAEHLSELLQG